MQRTLFALGALATVASALDMGKGIVQNNCDYDVHLANTPASGGGYNAIDQVIQPGESYEQTWTKLSNLMGWSLKLSNDSSFDHILQYEYTCLDDGIIWYDLSCVNGDPWPNNWYLSAEGSSCTPKQTAYLFPTDDANGMQESCSQDSVITVTLCSNSGSGSSNSTTPSPAPASAPAYSAPAPAPKSSSPAPAPQPAASSPAPAPAPVYSSASPTTTQGPSYPLRFPVGTESGSALDADVYEATVTQVETAYATEYVTATQAPHYRRHAHHHARRHNHEEQQ